MCSSDLESVSVNVGQEKRVVLDVLRAEHGVVLEGDGILSFLGAGIVLVIMEIENLREL